MVRHGHLDTPAGPQRHLCCAYGVVMIACDSISDSANDGPGRARRVFTNVYVFHPQYVRDNARRGFPLSEIIGRLIGLP